MSPPSFDLSGRVALVTGTSRGLGQSLARALARSIDCRFSRIQLTPDLLPGDVLGVSVFNNQTQAFDFKPGPEEGWMWVDPTPGHQPDPAKADLHAPQIADFRFNAVNVGSGGVDDQQIFIGAQTVGIKVIDDPAAFIAHEGVLTLANLELAQVIG